MKLITGLGNPGEKYRLTRHNVGFVALDDFARSRALKWDEKKRFKSWLAETDLNGRLLLAKPATFMNLSGEAIRALADFYSLKHHDILVIHDDADLEFGKMRLVQGGNDGGHQGVASLYQHGFQDVWRLKVGVANSERLPGQAIDFVLRNFDGGEQGSLPKIMGKIAEVIDEFSAGSPETRTIIVNTV